MEIEKLITDDQDVKSVEKAVSKLTDMLGPEETIQYIAVQKMPAVNLIPSSAIITDKRLIFCIPANLGLTTNFIIYSWKDVKEVSFKEEFFGARFTAVPLRGESHTIDYIPKVQARKLYQYSNQNIEPLSEDQRQTDNAVIPESPADQPGSEPVEMPFYESPAPVMQEHEDEITARLQKLKSLYEKELISPEEYESKKTDILSQL